MCESYKQAEQAAKDEANPSNFSCSKPATLTENMLAAFGNPLLDMVTQADDSMLGKYRLLPDNAILATKLHNPLYKELSNRADVKYLSGGSILNSVRVFQWVLRKPFVAMFFGCVGTDNKANILMEHAIADGINAQFQRTSEFLTGRCAVLVHGMNRSLIADLGAAPHFEIKYLHRYTNRKLLEHAKYYLTSGFFLQSSPDSVMELAELAHTKSCTFIFNLSSYLIVKECKEYVKKLLPYVDILIGDERETLALGSIMGWKPNVKQIAKQAFKLPKKIPRRQRIVIATRAEKPVVVVHEDFVREYPVEEVPPDKIVDTNGAGDAFLGAFLAQYLQGKEISVCVMWGMWAASVVIQNWGCSYVGKPHIHPEWLDGYLQCCPWIDADNSSPPKRA